MSLFTNFNLSEAKTSIPTLADGHLCRIRLAGVKGRKTDKGDSLSVEVHLLDPAPTNDGAQVQPGFPLFDNITFYDKNTPANEIPQRSVTKMAKIIDAFLGTGEPGNKKGRPARPPLGAGADSIEKVAAEFTEVLVGKEAYVKVKGKTGEFEGTEITQYINSQDLNA